MRRDNRHYLIQEDGFFCSFDVWDNNEVIGIHRTKDPNRAARFETREDAEWIAKRVCYPRSLCNYQIVRC